MGFLLSVVMMIAYVSVLIYALLMLGRLVRAVEKIARLLEKPTPAEQEQKQ